MLLNIPQFPGHPTDNDLSLMSAVLGEGEREGRYPALNIVGFSFYTPPTTLDLWVRTAVRQTEEALPDVQAVRG